MARKLRCTPILIARYRFPFPPLYNVRERNWEPPSNSVTDGTSKSVSTLNGARAYLRVVDKKTDQKAAWAQRLKERRHVNVAAVALAAKHARIAWAMLAKGTEYQPAQSVGFAA